MSDNRDIDDIVFLGKVPLANRRPGYLDGPSADPEYERWRDYQRRMDEWYEDSDIVVIDTPLDAGEFASERPTIPWVPMLCAMTGAFVGSVLTRWIG